MASCGKQAWAAANLSGRRCQAYPTFAVVLLLFQKIEAYERFASVR
jgi:hypothetical protein